MIDNLAGGDASVNNEYINTFCKERTGASLVALILDMFVSLEEV